MSAGQEVVFNTRLLFEHASNGKSWTMLKPLKGGDHGELAENWSKCWIIIANCSVFAEHIRKPY